jgi:Ca2+-binding RTX toxin-like protein
MTEISDRSSGYGFIAAVGVRQGARALSNLSQAAGRDVDLTQANLRTQAQNLNRVGIRVGNMAAALNGLEETRGVAKTLELTEALTRATRRAVNRLLQAESQANALSTPSPVGSGGKATIASAVASSVRDTSAGAAIASVLSRSLQGGGGKKPTPLSVLANAAAVSRGDQGDIFDRNLPTRVQASGPAQVEVRRRALEAQASTVVIDPNDPDAVLQTARVVDAGRATSSNEGFIITARTGDRGGTLALDMSDPAGNDGRLGTVDVEGGAGSDVIFISGANDSVVRAGAGNDYVMADGNGMLYGGDGDDILTGNIVFGENGDDALFGNTLAVGGEGNDRITMFALNPEDEEAGSGLAFGGSGDDTIIGEVGINADGGDGNDVISLRAGGFASGGAGDDMITSFDNATVEGGAGADDILMLAGGKADGGDGADTITTTLYATASGGKGNDIVKMSAGGIYQFAKGDGFDQVLMGSPLTGATADWSKRNTIEITGFNYAEMDVLISTNEITLVPFNPQSQDRLIITRALPGEGMDLKFVKDGKTQTITIDGNNRLVGPLVPVT